MSAFDGARLDHFGIMVADIDAAVDWYVAHLGAVVRDRWENTDAQMKWAHLDIGSAPVEFVQRDGLVGVSDSAAGFHHLALSVSEVDVAVRALEGAGGAVVFPPSYFDRHDMDWSFVRDPFGNILELISYRSRDRTDEP
jgi:catechol 2,3-dioxygenase-like lactoylglutathione lyase family enzyme